MNKNFFLLIFMIFNSGIAIGSDKEIIDFLKVTKIQTIDYESMHVCHLNNVYLKQVEDSGIRKRGGFMALVWNNEKNSPLLCTDYEEYIRSLYELKNEKSNSW